MPACLLPLMRFACRDLCCLEANQLLVVLPSTWGSQEISYSCVICKNSGVSKEPFLAILLHLFSVICRNTISFSGNAKIELASVLHGMKFWFLVLSVLWRKCVCALRRHGEHFNWAYLGALCKYRSEKWCLAIDVICGVTSRLKSTAVQGRAPGGEKKKQKWNCYHGKR